MINKILLHIGYHKTASTWLQNELFIADNNVFEPLSLRTKGKSTLSWKFIVCKDGYLLPSFDLNRKEISKGVLEILRQKTSVKDKYFVLSSERLSGKPHASGFDAKLVANRLNDIFPHGKVLIVVREQKSFIRSLYFQYLSNVGLGTFSIKKYLNLPYDSIPFFSPHHLNFTFIVKEYYKLFGRKNVLVLPYELFSTNPQHFISKLSDFVGKQIIVNKKKFRVKHNTNKSTFVLYHFRFLNILIGSRSLNNYSSLHYKYTGYIARGAKFLLMKSTPKFLNIWMDNKTKKYIRSWVGLRYEQSNIELSEMIGIDLSKYGYHNSTSLNEFIKDY